MINTHSKLPFDDENNQIDDDDDYGDKYYDNGNYDADDEYTFKLFFSHNKLENKQEIDKNNKIQHISEKHIVYNNQEKQVPLKLLKILENQENQENQKKQVALKLVEILEKREKREKQERQEKQEKQENQESTTFLNSCICFSCCIFFNQNPKNTTFVNLNNCCSYFGCSSKIMCECCESMCQCCAIICQCCAYLQ